MKDSTIFAKITALENASEFIRGHGEEGGIEDTQFDDFTVSEYLRQCKTIANKLDKMAERIKNKYGITNPL